MLCRCLWCVLQLMPSCCPRIMVPPGPYSSRWPVLPPGAIMLSRSKLFLMVISGSIVILNLGSVTMFIAHVTKRHPWESCVEKYVEVWKPCWDAPQWPWIAVLMTGGTRVLVLSFKGELAPSLGKFGPSLPYGCGRPGPTPYLREGPRNLD